MKWFYSDVCNFATFQYAYASSLLINILLSLFSIGQKDGDIKNT